MSVSKRLILEDVFQIRDINDNIKVGLNNDCIIFNSNGFKNEKLYLKDLIGTKYEKSYRTNHASCSLILTSFPFEDDTQIKRTKKRLELVYSKFKHNSEKNIAVVKKWHDTITKLLNTETNEYNSNKPFLVFLNPKSGSGKAMKIYVKNVFNIWIDANLVNEIVETGN